MNVTEQEAEALKMLDRIISDFEGNGRDEEARAWMSNGFRSCFIEGAYETVHEALGLPEWGGHPPPE